MLPDPRVYPKVRCEVEANGRTHAVDGRFEIPGLDYIDRSWQREASVVNIMCPGLQEQLVNVTGKLPVKLFVGDASAPTVTLDVCYRQVDVVHDVVACTEPMYGYNDGGFWQGEPRYDGHNLLDAFLLYHTKVHKMPVVVNDFESGFLPLLTHHLGDFVWHRPDWRVAPLGISNPLDYEQLAEATCHWERRLDARWVYVLHAADNFAMPMVKGELMSDVLRRLNASEVSSVTVPMIQTFSDGSKPASANVLQRWNLLGTELEFVGGRFTPLFNPRHLTHTHVHWNVGRMPSTKRDMTDAESVSQLRLHTVHIMSLARPHLNKRAGPRDEWLDHLADQLQEEIAKHKAKRGA